MHQSRDPTALARGVAEYFSSHEHGSHGRRIGRDDAKAHHLEIVDLENDQDLQDEVLTLYHLSTIAFEQGPALKSVVSSNGRMWVKNYAGGRKSTATSTSSKTCQIDSWPSSKPRHLVPGPPRLSAK